VAGSPVEAVVASTADQRVVSAAAEDRVVTRPSDEQVASGGVSKDPSSPARLDDAGATMGGQRPSRSPSGAERRKPTGRDRVLVRQRAAHCADAGASWQ